MNTLEAINSRRSIRYFNGELPTEEQLDAVLQAAQAAPAGMQWYDEMTITVISDSGTLFALNINAQMSLNRENDQFHYAPMYIVVSAKLRGTIADNIAYSNAATIVQNMVLAAVDQGLGACHIWGVTAATANNPDLVALLGLPEGQIPVAGLVLGQFDEEYTLREPQQRIEVRYL